jgi:hypothetical protein
MSMKMVRKDPKNAPIHQTRKIGRNVRVNFSQEWESKERLEVTREPMLKETQLNPGKKTPVAHQHAPSPIPTFPTP